MMPPSKKILELTEVLLVGVGGRGGQLEDVDHQEGQLDEAGHGSIFWR